MGLTDQLARWFRPSAVQRASPLSFDDWVSFFNFGNNQYGVPLFSQTMQGSREEIEQSFAGLVSQVYRSNGVVFAVEAVRVALFSEARFQFREIESGRPGKMFGGTDGRNPAFRDLSLLSNPWPGATTADLLARALLHADFAGTAFLTRRSNRIRLMRPDWVTILLGSPNEGSDFDANDLDAEIIGYLYHPGGRHSGRRPVSLLANEVAPFAPMPDPTGIVRGIPWMLPVIREIAGDSAMTGHKIKYFENAATPNLAVALSPDVSLADAREWIEIFRADHEGAANAYRTLFLGGGATPVPIGNSLQQIDFKTVQGAGETRIAAAGGVPPVIVGLSEGLASATYSNYGQARRRLADGTLRPLWRNFAGSLAQIIDVPGGSELWYDDRDIPFLQEDVKDAAEIQSVQAGSIQSLITSGYEPDAVLDAVIADDFARLRGKHSGFYSVQLQPLADPNVVPEPPQLPPGDVPAGLLEAGRSVSMTFEAKCAKCNRLLGKRNTPEPAGLETKCRSCGLVQVA